MDGTEPDTKLNPGDIVTNTFGTVMCVGYWQPQKGKWFCYYECAPDVGLDFSEGELRFLSSGKGVAMSAHNVTEFQRRIQRCVEWAKGVAGLPPKYRDPLYSKAKVPKSTASAANGVGDVSTLLKGMSLEQMEALLKELEEKKQ